MPVFRWGQTWDTFRDLEREFEGLLQSVNFSFPGIRVRRQYPAVNLYELSDEYLLTAELPGTKTEDLELTITDGILTIKGQRSDPEEIPDERFRRFERFRGSWQRSLSLPERVKQDELSAGFSNGILTVHLPKADEVKPRQIPVVDGGE